MLLIDFSQVFLSSIFSQIKHNMNVDEDLVRHIIVSSILSYKKKFGSEYGELVLCCDGRNYWRKKEFRYYKANRKKQREDSGLNWNQIYDALNTIRAELKENMPYRLIEIDTCEADDVIAILVKKYHEREPILILSGDRDFVALQQYKNVKQYSPIHKEFVTCDNPQLYLKEKILKGDAGDGVPNFLSPDDYYVSPDRKIKRLTQKKIDEYINKPVEFYEENLYRNYRRNEKLIDLNYIPSDLEENIIKCYEGQLPSKRNMMTYFIEKRLSMLLDNLNQF